MPSTISAGTGCWGCGRRRRGTVPAPPGLGLPVRQDGAHRLPSEEQPDHAVPLRRRFVEAAADRRLGFVIGDDVPVPAQQADRVRGQCGDRGAEVRLMLVRFWPAAPNPRPRHSHRARRTPPPNAASPPNCPMWTIGAGILGNRTPPLGRPLPTPPGIARAQMRSPRALQRQQKPRELQPIHENSRSGAHAASNPTRCPHHQTFDLRSTAAQVSAPALARTRQHEQQETPGQRGRPEVQKEPLSGFEPETYALRDRERSCCMVPRRAVQRRFS
jgi:hypothetical protein